MEIYTQHYGRCKRMVYPFHSSFLSGKHTDMQLAIWNSWFTVPQWHWIKFLYAAHKGGY
jgi:hypothetical protein